MRDAEYLYILTDIMIQDNKESYEYYEDVIDDLQYYRDIRDKYQKLSHIKSIVEDYEIIKNRIHSAIKNRHKYKTGEP